MNSVAFAPLPLLSNPHLQTVLSLWVKGARLTLPTRRYLVTLADGNALVLHDNQPAEWQPGQPAALILHGLTGSHRSAGVTRLARELLHRGVRTFRLDLRGAGAGVPYARSLYHGGCSDDVRAALAVVAGIAPGSPICLLGTSLGGNVALKVAGEAVKHPVAGLSQVAAINPPIDLAACTALLSQRGNRLYEWHFLYELRRDVRLLARTHGEPLPRFPRRMAIIDFDELYTAPRHGFASAADYYARSSSLPLAGRINVPALVLTARDDPFIAVEPFAELARTGNVEVRIADRGGHTGFLGRDGTGGIAWAEVQIADWLRANSTA